MQKKCSTGAGSGEIQAGNAEEMHSMDAGSDGDAHLVSHLEDWQQWKAGGSKYPRDGTLEPSVAGGLPCAADLSSPQLPEPVQSTIHPPANALSCSESHIPSRPKIAACSACQVCTTHRNK